MNKNKTSAPAKACVFFDICTVNFAESGEAEKNRFRIVGYSGEVIQDHWYWGNIAFDLSGMKFAKPVTPILAEHDRKVRLGFTDKQEIAEQVIVEGPFLGNDEATKLRDDMRAGFPMEASMYIPPFVVEQVSKGTSVQVNGRTLDGPGAVFRKSEIKEVSMCVFGADSHTASEAIAAAEHAESISYRVETNQDNFNGKDKVMSETKTEMTLASFKSEHTDLYGQVFEAGRTEGKKTEQDLFAAIVTACGDDHELAIKCYSEGKTAMEALKMRNEKLAVELKAAKEASARHAPDADPAEAEFADDQAKKAGAKSKDPAEQTEAEQRETFQRSKELQAEFGGDENAYIAFLKAEADGRAKVQGRK